MTHNNQHLDIVMPKLGLTMTEGVLTEWRVAEGDAVKQGDILFEFESEKSAMEFESPAAGVVAKIVVSAEATVPCGKPVATLLTGKAKPSAIAPANTPMTATPAAKRRARELKIEMTTVTGSGPAGRIHLADVELAAQSIPAGASVPAPSGTPLAKKVAAELNIDWKQLSGSGPGGRVVKEDVLKATTSQPELTVSTTVPKPASTVTTKPLSGVRAVIAKRMAQSAFTAPHVTLFAEADATHLVEARSQINAELGDEIKISFNAILIALLAKALQEHPHLNAGLVEEEIYLYHDIHIALAVDTERGLLVPVIRDVDQLDLVGIQQAGDQLIQRVLSGQSLPDDLTGGTFTLTNLGMFEIEGFTPIINQPQAAILGVGSIIPKPVVVDNNIVVRQRVMLSLSFDHRLVDGAPAAKFLQRVKHLVERPFALMVKRP